MIYTRFRIVFVLVFLATLVQAQDVHFTQFFASPLTLNPAMTGSTEGECRATLNFREQWGWLGSPFRTIAASYEQKINLVPDVLGVGGLLINDTDPLGALNSTYIYASAAYHKSLGNHHISLGFQPGYIQKVLDASKLTIPSDYSHEAGAFVGASGDYKDNISMFDANVGATWFGKLAYFDAHAGIAAFHLLHPGMDFDENDDKGGLATRWVVNGGLKYRATDKLNLFPNVIYMNQGKIHYLNAGGGVEYETGNTKGVTFVNASAYVRSQDAFILVGGFGIRNFSFGVSYDFNTISDLSTYSQNRGGMEISLTYRCAFDPKLPAAYIPCNRY